MKQFDLFIVQCDNPSLSFDYIIEEIERRYGDYINIVVLGKDDNSCFCRNFVPGSISLLEYINNSDNPIMSGYQKVQTANNGICLLSYNLSSDYKHSFEDMKDEDVIVDRIISAFYWGIALCKQLNYDIIGDGYQLIDDKFKELNINNKFN